MVEMISLGLGTTLTAFGDALDLQRRVHSEVAHGSRPPTLILVEHEPVYTAGRRTRAIEYPQPPLTAVDVDRGGKITWHGPGQLVIYPIAPLPQPLDVIAYVRALEQSVIETCANFGVTAQQVAGRSGVWHQPNPQISSPNKLCAIGVRVAQDTTLHGLALNCNNDLTPFTHITPCGISDAGITTLSHAAGTTITPTMVSEPLTDRLVVNFKELGIH